MDIIIYETKQREKLFIIDPEHEIEWTEDFIGNTGSLREDEPEAIEEGEFLLDRENDAYICKKETFEWWKRVIEETEATDLRIYELKCKYGSKAVSIALSNVQINELDDYSRETNEALDEVFGDEFK